MILFVLCVWCCWSWVDIGYWCIIVVMTYDTFNVVPRVFYVLCVFLDLVVSV